MSENVPGKNTRRMAGKRHLLRFILGVATLWFLLLVARNGIQTRAAIGALACILAMVGMEMFVLPMLDRLKVREKLDLRGAKAEETVGAILNRLSGKHRVFPDVPAPFGNIDHLVFRDDGAIFLIETRAHRGTVTVDRSELRRDGHPFERNFIKQTLNNVSWVKKSVALHFGFTPAWIHAAIVFTNAQVPAHCKLLNVAVIRPDYLERWMAEQSGADPASLHLWPAVDEVRRILEQNSRS